MQRGERPSQDTPIEGKVRVSGFRPGRSEPAWKRHAAVLEGRTVRPRAMMGLRRSRLAACRAAPGAETMAIGRRSVIQLAVDAGCMMGD
jgi:hypothetical protein